VQNSWSVAAQTIVPYAQTYHVVINLDVQSVFVRSIALPDALISAILAVGVFVAIRTDFYSLVTRRLLNQVVEPQKILRTIGVSDEVNLIQKAALVYTVSFGCTCKALDIAMTNVVDHVLLQVAVKNVDQMRSPI